MNEKRSVASPAPRTAPLRPWVSPEVRDLPRLTELTLQTGGGVFCPGTPGGSTVCP